MKVKSIKVGAVLSHKNDYGNDRLEIEIEVPEDENYADVYEQGRKEVYRLLGRTDLYDSKRKLEREYDEILRKLQDAYRQWNEMRDFLVAQGIKSDVAQFPQLKMLSEAIAPLEPELIDDQPF